MVRRPNAVAAFLLLSVLAPVLAESPGREIMTEEEKTNYELLLELTAASNAHDLDRIMVHFAEDSSLDMPRGSKPWGTRFIGKDAVRKGCR